jgi:hypothetical protein
MKTLSPLEISICQIIIPNHAKFEGFLSIYNAAIIIFY